MKAEARVLRSALMFERLRKEALHKHVEEKGFLGQSLRENPSVPSIGRRVAVGRGLIVDDAGKMRCPAGTPNANQFTDIQMSNCMIPSAETGASAVVNAAGEVVDTAKNMAPDGFRRSSASDKVDIKSANVGFPDADGFIHQKRIPIGNAVTSPVDGSEVRLNTSDDSVKYIADGGDLTSVPDEHVVKAILDNSGEGKRYSVIGTGGGVNGMTRMRDTKNGSLLGLKYADGKDSYSKEQGSVGHKEASNEFISELFAEHMGYEPVPMRVAPVITTQKLDWGNLDYTQGVALVSELVHNRRAGGIESARVDDRGGGYNYGDFSIESAIKMSILDMVITNRDRHEGNFLIERGGKGDGDLVPIDHSLAHGTGTEPTEFLDVPAPLVHFEIEKALVGQIDTSGRDSLNKIVAEMQEQLRSIDTEKLRSQIDEYVRHLRSLNINPANDEQDRFNRSVKMLEILRTTPPEDVMEKIFPTWRYDYYKKSNFSNGQPIVDLAAIAGAEGGPQGMIDL